MKVDVCRSGTICAGLVVATAILLHQAGRHQASVLAQTTADQPAPLRTFERYLPLETAEFTGGVSVGDLNGDGWLDIVLANGRHTPTYSRVLLNDGKGHFRGTNLGDHPARSFCAVLADIDGDGDLDIIVGNDWPDRKMIFKNDGNGRFTDAGSWGAHTWPTRYVTVADLNGDGYPDIVAANAASFGGDELVPVYHPSYACLNDGKGAFPACLALPTQSAVVIPAADFDGDGALDLLVPHRDGGRGFVLWTNGKLASSQTFADWIPHGNDGVRSPFRDRTFIGPPQMSVRVAAVGDFDGNGRPDFVIYDSHLKRTSVFLNSGARSFRESYTLPTGDRIPNAIAVADMNKDGRPDIVVGYFNSEQFLKFRGAPSRGSVFFNQGKDRGFVEVPWNDGKGAVQQIAIADMDNDGWPDIVGTLDNGAPSGIWFSTNPHR
jgi:hypothetical protein